jgi:hypothetical protein
MKNLFKLSQVDLNGMPGSAGDAISINVDVPKFIQQMGLQNLTNLQNIGNGFDQLADQLEKIKDPRATQARNIMTQISNLQNSIKSFK